MKDEGMRKANQEEKIFLKGKIFVAEGNRIISKTSTEETTNVVSFG